MSGDPGACEERLLLRGARPEPAGDRLLETRRVWLADDARPWQPDAVNVLIDKLVFRPRLVPVQGTRSLAPLTGQPSDRGEDRHPTMK